MSNDKFREAFSNKVNGDTEAYKTQLKAMDKYELFEFLVWLSKSHLFTKKGVFSFVDGCI